MWVLSAVAVVLGFVGGGAAFVLFKLIGLMTHLTLLHDVGFDLPTLRGYHPSLWLIPITVVGGLLVSLFAMWSPVIRGHGIPESMEAILDNDSRIKPRAAIAKPLSAAITIGTGGPFGAEGPIIVTGGSIGSLIGQMLSVSAAERKIMLATGAAAGMSATFNTPIAAVILAIELVLFERSLRVIVPLSIASGIAASIHILAFGGEPLFAVQTVLHVSLAHLPLFVVVGLASGVMAIVLNKGLFAMEAAFRRLPINIFWWPAIGALGFATIGMFVPRTLSMGYSAIVDTLNGKFTIVALAVLLVAKLLSWLIALGSQTSGGTLAPMFLVGATMGALLGDGVNALFPAWHVSPAAFALVAMGATFGAATKALFASVVFAAEVTGEHTMIIPLLIGAAVAELVVEGVLSDRMMTEKLTHRGFRVEFRTAVDTLRTRVARQIMREAVWAPADATPSRARQIMAAHDLTEVAVVGSDGHYAGLLRAAAIDPAVLAGGAGTDTAGGPSGVPGLAPYLVHVEPIVPDEYLATSLERFLANRVDALPVVDHGAVVGLIGRDDIDVERYRRGAAQEVRQSGWLAAVPWRRRHAPLARSALTVMSTKIVIPPIAPLDPGEAAPTPHAVAAAAPGRRAKRPAHDRLLPDPVQLTPGLGQFLLSDRSRIVVAWDSASAHPVAERLADELRRATGLRLRVSDGRAYRDDIAIRLGSADGLPEAAREEGYALTVGVMGVTLTAPTLRGLHNGAQTIRQLLPVWASSQTTVPGPWAIPAAVVVDYPRRARRGLALDLTSGLLSPVAVSRIIDRISAYKINALRLVLSAAQAERLAAALPGETTPAGWREAPDSDPRGLSTAGYWTALEFRALQEFAAERFVTLDIDIAGAERAQSDGDQVVIGGLDETMAAAFTAVTADAHGVEAVLPGGAATGLTAIQRAVFPQALALAEAGWSPRAAIASGPRGRADFLARLATQAPRLALHDTAFGADPAVPWRTHMIAVPGAMHRRRFDGTFALVVAPGRAVGDLRAEIDWGDGTTSPAVVVADRGDLYRFRVTGGHRYANPGIFRAAVTVTAPGAVAARASMRLRAGSTGALHRGHAASAAPRDGRQDAELQAGSVAAREESSAG